MKVLVVGNGGREHALAWRLAASPSVTEVVCPGGNPGIEQVARCPSLEGNTHAHWLDLARTERVDLVVVGPEAPLAEGLGDDFRNVGFTVFGPGRDGAMIESSKAFAKDVMRAAGVPTAKAKSFTDPEQAKDYAHSLGLPVVIKADGLAAGKGVTIATSREEAEKAIDENLSEKRFGASSERILVEECMVGPEASVFGLCDGKTVYPLVPAQDHKRAYDGDKGPNTGGMGAYAPVPVMTEELFTAAFSEILRPTLEEMAARGIEYRGVLYAGLMLTEEGPKVVEFNCRFGDPEAQVILPLLEGDLGEILLACAEGRLEPMTMAASPTEARSAPTGIATAPGHCVTVVLASGGYPGSYPKGLPITGLEEAANMENAMVFHAGTARGDSGEVVTAGGRVLSCTAWDRTLARAVEKAYALADRVDFEGKMFRRDIAARALPKEE